jgi:glycosyltransferase involved in cell wall biosynthesis
MVHIPVSDCLLTLVVPCYNEEASIPLFVEGVEPVLDALPILGWEVIFVDDGSKDRTLDALIACAKRRSNYRYFSFSRNFGKEAALLCGMREAAGDLVGVMDVDLQDPPQLLESMLAHLGDPETDCVATRRVSRKGEPLIRSVFARLFYRLINRISDTEIVDGARDYRVMRRDMVDAILALPEYNRFSKGIFSWVGFRTKWLEFENVERVAGTTKWSFWKLFRYSLGGIVGFSTAPLAIASVLGLLFCALAFVMIIVVVLRQALYGDPVAGWASLICVIMFLGGLQMTLLGIIGQYLAKTYLETKRRPAYFVRKQSTRD